MQKIDRLGWAEGIAFRCYGAQIGIRVSDPTVLNRLPDHLPPNWRSASDPWVDTLFSWKVGGETKREGVRNFHIVYADSVQIARTLDAEEALAALEAALHTTVAIEARSRVFVRAGVVGWRGRAIVLPGRPGRGISTLVAALVKAGATYYSDSYAVFDGKGRVHPYPNPRVLHGDPESSPLLRECLPGTKPLPVGLVLATEYRSGIRWRARTVSPGLAAMTLLDVTVGASARAGKALSIFRDVLQRAEGLQGRRGEADECAAALLRRIGDWS